MLIVALDGRFYPGFFDGLLGNGNWSFKFMKIVGIDFDIVLGLAHTPSPYF